MSGFVSLPPAGPGTPPALPDAIDAGAFWPAMSLAVARAALPIPTDTTDERLRQALVAAIIEATDDLASWAALRQAAGAATLAGVPQETIGGEGRLVALFRRAVHELAAADLNERQRRPDTASAGTARAEALDNAADDHRRNARWAIRAILGVRRTTVELI